MKSKWWLVGMVVLLWGVILTVTRTASARTVGITLSTERVVLGDTIDDLTAPVDVLQADESTIVARGEQILRGERDVTLTATERHYQWDGTDSATTLRTNGLGGWDATRQGIVSRWMLDFGAGKAAIATLSLYDTLGNQSSTRLSIPADGGTLTLPLTTFKGVDLAQIGAVELKVPNNATLLGIRTESDLRATQSTTLTQDRNNDGRADKGDLVRYEVTFTNEGTQATGAAIWETTISNDHMTMLNAVQLSNAQADVNPQTRNTHIRVALPELAGGESASVGFDARLQGGVVPITIVVEEGEVLPEGTAGTVNSPFTSGTGEVGLVGNLGTTDRFVWFDEGIIWQNSDAAPTNTLTGAEGTMGVGNNGEFIYSPSVNGGDAVWTHAGALLVDGQPAPNFPSPAANTFNSRPHMMPNGTSLWVAGTDLAGGNTTQHRTLYQDADGAPGGITTLLQTGTVYDGFPIVAPAGLEFDYQQSDNLAHLMVTLALVTGSSANDGVLGINGEIVAREGSPTGSGDGWANFDSPSVNNSGNYVFAGDTNGVTTSDEFVAYGTSSTTPTIGIREGSTLDGVLLPAGATVNALSINNLNQAAFIWSYTGGETLFVACDASNLAGAQAILSMNDEYDADGGGADGFIDDFNASAAIGPGLWLAEDGMVYAEVDLAPPVPFVGGLREAVIGVETNCNTTGATPTPTNTAVPTTNTPTATNTAVPPTNTATSTPQPTATATVTTPPSTFTPTTIPSPTVTPTSQRHPDIFVTPDSFTENHSTSPQVTTDTLIIGNARILTFLNWTITEDDSRPFAHPNPIQPRDPNAPVERLGAAGGKKVSPLVLGPIVGDGSFETGTPNSSWEEFSSNFGTPLCDAACGAGGGTGPRTGAWWSWFGGTTAAETGILTQTVTIPNGSAELTFWLEIPATATGTNGFLSVRMDGTELFRAEETTTGYGTYAEVSVDVSAYANGNAHDLVFFSQTDAGVAVTNFFVDDVAITVTGGGQCTAPTNIPWLTVSPSNGSTNGGSTTPVTLTYNSASLAQGTYTGTLCIASNDPVDPLVTVPVTLNVGPPTAIDLTAFSIPVAPMQPYDIVVAGMLVLSALVLLRRRR